MRFIVVSVALVNIAIEKFHFRNHCCLVLELVSLRLFWGVAILTFSPLSNRCYFPSAVEATIPNISVENILIFTQVPSTRLPALSFQTQGIPTAQGRPRKDTCNLRQVVRHALFNVTNAHWLSLSTRTEPHSHRPRPEPNSDGFRVSWPCVARDRSSCQRRRLFGIFCSESTLFSLFLASVCPITC